MSARKNNRIVRTRRWRHCAFCFGSRIISCCPSHLDNKNNSVSKRMEKRRSSPPPLWPRYYNRWIETWVLARILGWIGTWVKAGYLRRIETWVLARIPGWNPGRGWVLRWIGTWVLARIPGWIGTWIETYSSSIFWIGYCNCSRDICAITPTGEVNPKFCLIF